MNAHAHTLLKSPGGIGRNVENLSLSAVRTKIRRYCQRNAAVPLFRRLVRIETDVPLISFTFDDFPRSALLTAGSLLAARGIAGTYYVSLGLMGRLEAAGRMFEAGDIATLLRQTHELGCHTYSHCHSWNTTTQTFEHAIVQNARALARLAPGLVFRSFSYPICAPRPLTKKRLARYFESCRGGGQAANVGIADVNQLKAYFLEKSRDQIDDIKAVIDANRRARGWLIFATHDVANDHTPYGCTPAFFEDVLEYAIQSGARLLPVARALAVLKKEPSADTV